MGYLQRLIVETRHKNDETVPTLLGVNPQVELPDCGCGDGIFTAEAARRIGTAKTSGIEFETDRAAKSHNKGIGVARADLNEILPFEDDRFDVIVANQVIEHMHNTNIFIRELRRILKPQAYAVIATDSLASWDNVLSLVLSRQPMPRRGNSGQPF